MQISLVIADDHEVVRSGIASLLEGTDIRIVAEASNGDEAAEMTLEHQPDVLLLDIRMIESDGLSAIEKLRDQNCRVPIVILSTYDNPTYIARSLALGACDYVLKGTSKEQLITALERAVRGETPAPESPVHRVKEVMQRRKVAEHEDVPLTNREMQVLRHLALGLSNKDIGQSLNISVETVKEHVQNILRKLQVTDRTQAAVLAVKKGYV